MAQLMFKCPHTGINVQHWLEEAQPDERHPVYEAVIWKESVTIVDDNELYAFLGVQQESIVVPENIDAIRGMMGGASQADSIKMTNASLGIADATR